MRKLKSNKPVEWTVNFRLLVLVYIEIEMGVYYIFLLCHLPRKKMSVSEQRTTTNNNPNNNDDFSNLTDVEKLRIYQQRADNFIRINQKRTVNNVRALLGRIEKHYRPRPVRNYTIIPLSEIPSGDHPVHDSARKCAAKQRWRTSKSASKEPQRSFASTTIKRLKAIGLVLPGDKNELSPSLTFGHLMDMFAPLIYRPGCVKCTQSDQAALAEFQAAFNGVPLNLPDNNTGTGDDGTGGDDEGDVGNGGGSDDDEYKDDGEEDEDESLSSSSSSSSSETDSIERAPKTRTPVPAPARSAIDTVASSSAIATVGSNVGAVSASLSLFDGVLPDRPMEKEYIQMGRAHKAVRLVQSTGPVYARKDHFDSELLGELEKQPCQCVCGNTNAKLWMIDVRKALPVLRCGTCIVPSRGDIDFAVVEQKIIACMNPVDKTTACLRCGDDRVILVRNELELLCFTCYISRGNLDTDTLDVVLTCDNRHLAMEEKMIKLWISRFELRANEMQLVRTAQELARDSMVHMRDYLVADVASHKRKLDQDAEASARDARDVRSRLDEREKTLDEREAEINRTVEEFRGRFARMAPDMNKNKA